ncbi:helix-turn-helix domain-containing protein [Streptomyces sp. NPDC021100]|uniref:helix-turn-helix domain-containing protein n=1 Tax=Streptomyces sp. NPDC021100 TaxID=3365114 RepID=UPI0037A672DC
MRAHRLAKGWLQKQLGKEVALDNTAISHFEKGSHIPRRDVTLRIDKALDADGAIFKLRDELDDNPDAKWLQRFLKEYARATTIHHITDFTPAVLETVEHTRLALEAGLPLYGGDLESKVAFRAELCEIMLRPDPPRFQVILGGSGSPHPDG